MEDLEPSAASLEESIKRVVCIEDRALDRSFVVTEVMYSGVQEAVKDCETSGKASEIRVIDVVSGRTPQAENLEPGSDASKVKVIDSETSLESDEVAPQAEDFGPPQAENLGPATTSEGLDEQLKVVDGQEPQPQDDGDPVSDDSDSEDDLQLIVNDEDIFYPHGVEGVEDAEPEEVFAVGGEEHYEEVDWAAEMRFRHSQFKYVRPGSGPATTSPGVPDPQTPGATAIAPIPFAGYGLGMWDFHTFQPAYEFVLPPSKTVFDIDIDQFEEKPWEYEGTDITDYFNFGFTEDTWKQYCEEFARAKAEASKKSKMRGLDNGHSQQGWNYDNARYNDTPEPQRGRAQGQRGMRNHSGRAIQVEEGENERRSSELRRQRLRDSEGIQIDEGRYENSHGEFRRKQRNDDLPRRKGFHRESQSAEQTMLCSSPLSGRLGGRTPPGPRTNLGGIYSGGIISTSTSGRSTFSSRSSPGGVQGSVENGFRTLSKRLSEEEETPVRRSPPRFERASASAPQRRLGEMVAEKPQRRLSDVGTEKPPRRLSDLMTEKPPRRVSELMTEKPPRRLSELVTEKAERRSSELVTEKAERRPSELVTEKAQRKPSELVAERRPSELAREKPQRRLGEQVEKRPISLVRRVTQLVNETKSPQEKKLVSTMEPARRTIRLNAERRSQLISERTADRVERRSEVTVERRQVSLRAADMEFEQDDEEEQPARDSNERIGQPRQLTRAPSLSKSEDRPKFKQQDSGAKDDLRMKVLEKVSARWKLHLRMDDAHARRKRENLSKPDQKDNEEGAGGYHNSTVRDTQTAYASEELEDDNRRERKEERKRRHKDRRERRRLKSEDEDARDCDDYYQEVDERWQMEDADFTGHECRDDRKRKRRRYDDVLGVEEDEVSDLSERRSQRYSDSRYRRRDYNDDGADGWEMEEGECEEVVYVEDVECEDDRWEDDGYTYKRKRRRYNDELFEMDRDYETDNPGDERDYSYDESPSGQADDLVYKRQENPRHRETDRWTGTLDDSCDEYDEYDN
ncbi:trichohyalin [Selaginella moellendorffii]|uniref:trichohyalin n=1 Tax=Selaginella moellendorffii TaxID=88036 RepID=UPI000D1CD53D|nr:trichohyalin [Selaginella moellendorffii]|eukprot:XP_024539135.1 trichohyalin [Selaginella moellendorffii]